MKLFKLATIVAFTAGFAHTIHAADLGGNFALNTDIKTTYMVDAETTVATINPELSYNGFGNFELEVGTTLNLWENVGTTSDITDELDHLPVLEFGATYNLSDNMDLELGWNYDLEAEKRSDISLSASFNF